MIERLIGNQVINGVIQRKCSGCDSRFSTQYQIGAENDRFERQVDRVSEQIMRMSSKRRIKNKKTKFICHL